MLNLSETQVNLLIAMIGPCEANIGCGRVWVGKGRPSFNICDLFALRAARLIKPAEVRWKACGYYRFELTDTGAEEANRRAAAST